VQAGPLSTLETGTKEARMPELINIPSPEWPLTFGDEDSPVAIVIVHDEYGRLPYLEAYATALARRGFSVLIPDLFNGLAAIDDEGVAELRSRLDDGFALAAVEDAIELGRSHGASRVGMIGLGLGGWFALRTAQLGTVDAVVAYYAGLSEEEAGILPCPVALHFSERDEWGNGLEADLFVSRLKELGTPVTRNVYAGTGDGFANATILSKLDRNAAALAFARTTAFLEHQLAE
jgi:carboxymethylenebutenolidase